MQIIDHDHFIPKMSPPDATPNSKKCEIIRYIFSSDRGPIDPVVLLAAIVLFAANAFTLISTRTEILRSEARYWQLWLMDRATYTLTIIATWAALCIAATAFSIEVVVDE